MAIDKKTIIVAAGGTGGHLFPAEALAAALESRGFNLYLFTDERACRFVSHFEPSHIHIIPSATIKGRNPIHLLRTLWQLWCGWRRARQLFRKLKPSLVVGFGGYPTLPPMLAATGMKIPTLIHEQNAVMGRANRLLSGRVTAIAGGFLEKSGRHSDKITLTGNPLRPDIIKAAAVLYQPPDPEGDFRLLIFGGSQGASVFSTLLPRTLALMSPQRRARLKITQQARIADLEGLAKTYEDLNIDAEIAPFFSPMAEKMVKAHLIIARSGASSVAEIAALGRPSLLVPYPGALDHDQAANASLLAAKGGARLEREQNLTPQRLYEFLERMMNHPQDLVKMARQARAAGHLQATQHLADLAMQLIGEDNHENAA